MNQVTEYFSACLASNYESVNLLHHVRIEARRDNNAKALIHFDVTCFPRVSR
jgi:hypothetical protein